jgi:hypothetical protein
VSEELILGFPVLKDDGGDFLGKISYSVEAIQHQNDRKLIITHTLKGNSFIAELIKNQKAKFSVSLFYKGNFERQSHICESFTFDKTSCEIIAKQDINIDFRYAPEITPNIITLEQVDIFADEKSGLTNFWQNEKFNIPIYSRVANHFKLKFSSGDVSSLLNVSCNESFDKGSLKTVVSETVGEAEQPIEVICAQDVFDELKKGVPITPNDAKTTIRTAIVTQILCHVYAYMNNLTDKETDIHSGLLEHMKTVKRDTGQDWEGELNASFAATKMLPYAIDALNLEND